MIKNITKSKTTGSKTKKVNNVKCSTCRKPKPSSCKTKTCDVCKKRAAQYRDKKKKIKYNVAL